MLKAIFVIIRILVVVVLIGVVAYAINFIVHMAQVRQATKDEYGA